MRQLAVNAPGSRHNAAIGPVWAANKRHDNPGFRAQNIASGSGADSSAERHGHRAGRDAQADQSTKGFSYSNASRLPIGRHRLAL